MNSKPVDWIMDDDCYIFECPHCGVPIQVEGSQVNCRIFRHGQMKNTYMVRFSSGVVRINVPLNDTEAKEGVELRTGDHIRARSSPESDYEDAQILAVHQGQQVPPHAPQKICDDLVARGLIWGCGKPFKLVRGVSGRVESAVECGHI